MRNQSEPEARVDLATSTITAISALDAMWAQVDAARERLDMAVVPRPLASFTIREYAMRHGVSENTAQGHIERMLKAGQLRRIRCIVPSATGRAVPTNVYVTPDVE